ncbi:MAG: efflux RND transporter periplasmic adaptor subunit [Nitrospira sp.]|nr:efflux RND transporter periplasmic adaptor subunit [Nitrospira sp.]
MTPRRTIYLLILSLSAILGLFAVRWTGLTSVPASEGPSHTPSATTVVLAPVTIDRIRHTIRAVGTLRANESIMIRPQVAGRIRQVWFEEGQAVEKDQLLIELDDSELQAELAQAAAQLKVSRLTYERLKQLDLDGKRYVPKQQLDEVAGALQVSQANHALYATRLAKTKIRAPFTGITGIRRISPGDFVGAGLDLVNLEDLAQLKIDFKVPETLLRHLAPGQPIELTTDAYPGETFRGTVYVIDPQVEMTTRSVQVRARIPNQQQRLRPGMFAQVLLTYGEEERALVIPEEAVMPKQGGAYVYLAQDGQARLRQITIGTRSRGFVQVLSGLTTQDTVIRVGHHKLQEGDPILALADTVR